MSSKLIKSKETKNLIGLGLYLIKYFIVLNCVSIYLVPIKRFRFFKYRRTPLKLIFFSPKDHIQTEAHRLRRPTYSTRIVCVLDLC